MKMKTELNHAVEPAMIAAHFERSAKEYCHHQLPTV